MKNINPDLKPFYDEFMLLSRKYGYFYIWEDFLEMFINGFSFNYCDDKKLEEWKKKYTEQERHRFGKLIQIVILLLDKKVQSDKCWYDFFGHFYETATLSKQKGFAQFFTPESICNFMAQILEPQKRESFSDPCCGSGRFSLSANSVNIGMFHFLVDIDFTCVKMATINLMMHGIRGIVICDNGLFPGKEFKGAFIINRNLSSTGLPQIEYINNVNEAYNFVRYNTWSLEDFEKNKDKLEKNNFDDIKYQIGKNGQLKMF